MFVSFLQIIIFKYIDDKDIFQKVIFAICLIIFVVLFEMMLG